MENILILGISLIRSLSKPNEENFHWLINRKHSTVENMRMEVRYV